MAFMNHNRRSLFRALAGLTLPVPFFRGISGRQSSVIPPGINVELVPQTPLLLRVTVRSGAKTTAKFSRHKLPWGSVYSMVLVAVIRHSMCIERTLEIDDPVSVPFLLQPNESLAGEINLEDRFPDLRRVLKEVDALLFWAYESPEALQIPRWSGGWILIPQQK